MKQLFLSLIFLLLCTTINAAIWRVNNNFGIGANFTNAQAAHGAASNGDTIYLESSATPYGSLSCSKQLVWIGMGYFIDPAASGNNTGLQFHVNPSTIYSLNLLNGSANSVFMGLSINNVYVSSNNITISRCYVGSLEFYATSANLTSNFTLNQSFVTNNISQYSYNGGSSNSTGFAFTNNIILGTISLPANYLGIILNGNFIHQLYTLAFVVSNNIINSGMSTIGVYASNVYNNLFVVNNNANYVGNNGNIFTSSNPYSAGNSVFTSSVSGGYDSWVNLKPGSLAIGAGLNGIDIGPRGGTSPYKLSGIPNVPTISQFQFRSTPSNTLPVTISTRSNSSN